MAILRLQYPLNPSDFCFYPFKDPPTPYKATDFCALLIWMIRIESRTSQTLDLLG